MYRRMMRISWREHRTNNSILEELQPTCRFLAEVKQRKLQYIHYFVHVVRADNLCTYILHGIIAGNRRRGRPRRRWIDDIKQWTGIPVADCVQRARDRSVWRSLVSVSVTSDPQTWGRTWQDKARHMELETSLGGLLSGLWLGVYQEGYSPCTGRGDDENLAMIKWVGRLL